MKSQLFVAGNMLYVYGGFVEDRTKEVTLDDMWAIDLRTRTEWTPLLSGTMHVREWRGDDEPEDDPDEDDDGSEEDDLDDDDDDSEDGDGEERKAAKEVYDMTLRERQKRLKLLRDTYDLSDPQRTPGVGEKLSAFFKRTVATWVQKVASKLVVGEKVQGKELRRKAFQAARERYNHLWPVLEELNDLESEQAELEKGSRSGRGKPSAPMSDKAKRQAKRAAKQRLAVTAAAEGD